MNMLNARDSLKSAGRPSVGWLWVLALLALPGCADIIGVEPWDPKTAFTTLVFCDIPKPETGGPVCAAGNEMGTIRQNAAAVALTTGDTSNITLDESEDAHLLCIGQPRLVVFDSPFPQGLPTCVDPSIDAKTACVALCNGESPDPVCSQARASTNVPAAGFALGCNVEGVTNPLFVDPRLTPEKVVWDSDPQTFIGVSATPNSNDLKRTKPTSPPMNAPPFDAGAASTQWIEHGDAYVEFSTPDALMLHLSHVIGLAEIPDNCPCPDTDPSFADITFAISLNKDGNVYLLDSGNLIMDPDANGMGPDVNGSFGPYAENERFRVSLRQSSDGSKTATVTFSRITGSSENVFYTHVGLATYPLRVDTSFREVDASLSNVVVVRIQ